MGSIIGPSRVATPGGGAVGVLDWSPFAMTSAVTVGNTGVETSLFGSGVGTRTIPAGYLAVGSVIKVYITGSFGTNLVVPSITLKLYYGSTVLSTAASTPVAQIAASSFFEYTATCTVTAIGASGSLTSGQVMWPRTLVALAPAAAPAAATVDTTAAGTIDVRITWGTADAANTITAGSGYIEVVG